MKPFIPSELPVEGIDYLALLPHIGKANRSLAQYDGLVENSPNPDIFLTSLAQREALDSSRIEGLHSTLGEVFRFSEEQRGAIAEERRDDLREIANYAVALRLAETELKDGSFTLDLLRKLHARLLDSVRGQRKSPGEFRDVQNWIARPGAPVEQALFVPPAPERVPEFVEKWRRFYHSEQPDVLVQAAVLHGQFELIHPFRDGNGRLGRILIPIFMHDKGVLSRPNFYLSTYLERHRGAYMGALRGLNVRPGDWNRWIAFFLGALSVQATEDRDKIRKTIELHGVLKKRFINLTRSPFAISVLDAIFERPVFSVPQISKALAAHDGSPSAQALRAILKKLVGDGVLRIVEPGRGRRPATYDLPELMDLLEEREAS